MTERAEYKENLGQVDKETRMCLLYLEDLIDKRFQMAMQIKHPPPPKVDLSRVETLIDSLQKQLDGLRPKVEASYELTTSLDDQEKYVKKLTKQAEELIEVAKTHFQELYDSGYYSEGQRRQIRHLGLVKEPKEKVVIK